MGKILTISVAAYNVEKYLENLCKSIINSKKLDKIEVLIVDDGSKDKTGEIAKRYVACFPQSFVYIQKENGGHGSTINTGIKNATGKYFKVLDGDDWMDSRGLANLIDELIGLECDAVITNRKSIYENTGKIVIDKTNGFTPGVIEKLDEVCPHIGRLFFHSIYFKTEILRENNIYIDENSFYVDNEILWFPFPFIQTICYLNLDVYCYRLGLADQSVNVKVITRRKDEHERISKKMIDFFSSTRVNLSQNKREYLSKVIADNISWHFDVLLLCPISRSIFFELISYRKYVLSKFPDVMKYANNNTMKLLVKNPYLFYVPTWIKKWRIRKTK